MPGHHLRHTHYWHHERQHHPVWHLHHPHQRHHQRHHHPVQTCIITYNTLTTGIISVAITRYITHSTLAITITNLDAVPVAAVFQQSKERS